MNLLLCCYFDVFMSKNKPNIGREINPYDKLISGSFSSVTSHRHGFLKVNECIEDTYI